MAATVVPRSEAREGLLSGEGLCLQTVLNRKGFDKTFL